MPAWLRRCPTTKSCFCGGLELLLGLGLASSLGRAKGLRRLRCGSSGCPASRDGGFSPQNQLTTRHKFRLACFGYTEHVTSWWTNTGNPVRFDSIFSKHDFFGGISLSYSIIRIESNFVLPSPHITNAFLVIQISTSTRSKIKSIRNKYMNSLRNFYSSKWVPIMLPSLVLFLKHFPSQLRIFKEKCSFFVC